MEPSARERKPTVDVPDVDEPDLLLLSELLFSVYLWMRMWPVASSPTT